MASRACIIFNPRSGSRNGDNPWDALLKGHDDIELMRIGSPEDLPQIVKKAVDQGFDPIIAAGGDGTISAIAGQLAGTGSALGVVPMGTFNYFARSLGLPEDPAAALEIALGGAERRMSIGEVNGRVFLNNASLGAYAAILQVREGVYARWGRSRLAAYWSVIVAMSTIYSRLRMRITVDGKTHDLRSPMAFVSVSSYQLEEFDLAGVQEVENGRMVAFLAHDTGRAGLFWRACKIFFRGARHKVDYRMYSGDEIVIETARDVRTLAHDGEKERMRGPFHFRVMKDALRVRVPKDDGSGD